jgi:Tfp pilus assembly protein PilF
MTLLGLLITAVSLAGCASDPRSTAERNEEAWAKMMTEAQWHESSGRVQEAITRYVGAIDLKPTAAVWHRIGVLHLQQKDEYSAMSAFQQAVALDAEFAPAYEEMGLLFLHWKQKDKARAVLSRALELDDTRWRSHNAMAILADLELRHDDARALYTIALQHKPDSAAIINNIGYSRFLAGDADRAAEYLVQALRIDAEHQVAWGNLAKVMARQGRYADAFNILERKHPTAVAYHDVGYIALLNGDFVQAEDYLSKALSSSPRYFEEAFHNRTAARNRLIGNREGSFVVRQSAEFPYCIGLGGSGC